MIQKFKTHIYTAVRFRRLTNDIFSVTCHCRHYRNNWVMTFYIEILNV